MTLQSFIAEWSNKLVKSPHGILGQCVSISSEWAVENGWPELSGPTAWSIFQNFRSPAYVVYKVGHGYPVAGDIIFFNQTYGQGDGHTGVVVSANTTTISVFQQNDPDGSPAHLKNYNYVGVAGWFHPVGESMIPDADHLNALFRAFLGRNANDSEVKQFVGFDYSKMVEILDDNNAEHDAVVNALAVGRNAVQDKWADQIHGLEAQVASLKAGKHTVTVDGAQYTEAA